MLCQLCRQCRLANLGGEVQPTVLLHTARPEQVIPHLFLKPQQPDSELTSVPGWQLPAAIEPRASEDADQDWPSSGSIPHRTDSVLSNATFKSKFAFLSGKIRKDDSDMLSIMEDQPIAGPSRIETLPDDFEPKSNKPKSKWLVPKHESFPPAQEQHERSSLFTDSRLFQRFGSHESGVRSSSISSSNTTPSSYLTPSTSDASSRKSNLGVEELKGVDQSRSRFDSAPEVVTEDTMPRAAYMHPQRHASMWDYSTMGRIADTIWEPPLPNTEPLEPWSPLDKPTRKNNYHSFCEGAWLTRSFVKSGLSISQKPHGLTTLVPYWQCKKCQFSCIAPCDNKKVLPPQIYTSHHGIRYRWLFLAKSHMKSSDPTSKVEAYTYGCIFCTAEGRITSAYGTLDTLMEHIATQHGRQTMLPATREKTRCIFGRPANIAETWDVNILEQRQSAVYEPVLRSPIYQGIEIT
ncbi:hypothetical protein K431DRAFT_117736 [Polychaeton citri CBS 116435]|uniref:Uncharacterized protein n=1 Tax=Polychaeton citri CBS 116435 TaxID=1314669 RepID=A0A9P4UQZ1_9PEZI|nr:hypothetical protein K431DRAFT_117736 [Polychaeton citri CBS 116435]